MTVDKVALKAKMLSLENAVIEQAQRAYDEFVGNARVDREQAVELDDVAQSSTQRDLAEEVADQLNEHDAHIAKIKATSFEPATEVQPGAVVKLVGSDRHLVVAISTVEFVCQGVGYLGISPESPIYQAMEGLEAGDAFEINGQEREVERVW